MSEVEFDRLLDAVNAAIAPVPQDNFVRLPLILPKAVNDNDQAWPLIPFPDGWNAAC